MKYRLAPFCNWREGPKSLVITTPDDEIHLVRSARDLLLALEHGEASLDDRVAALGALHAVVGRHRRETTLLCALEDYFRTVGERVTVVRKGATSSSAAVPGYAYKATDGRNETFGHDQSQERALLKAVVELYERQSCDARRNVEILTSAKAKALAKSVVAYAPWQRRLGTVLYRQSPSGVWAACENVVTGETRSIAWELVCYPHRLNGPVLTECSSNGVAAHPDPEQARFLSAAELIERDALMVHWFHNLAREQIRPTAQVARQVRNLERLGFHITFVNLTLELLPVVLAIAHRDTDLAPRLLLGMSCDSSAAVAMQRALSEVQMGATYTDLSMREIDSAADVTDVIDHQLWYDRVENHAEVLGLVGPDEITVESIPAGPANVPELAKELQRHGFEWFTARLNQAGEAGTGVTVIRSIIPGMVPIAFGYGREPLGMRRLRAVRTGRTSQTRYRVQPFS